MKYKLIYDKETGHSTILVSGNGVAPWEEHVGVIYDNVNAHLIVTLLNQEAESKS